MSDIPETNDASDAITAWTEEDTTERNPETDPEPRVEAKPKAEAKPQAKPTEKPPEKRTIKTKVNGRETEIDAEPLEIAAKALGLDADTLARGAQMFRAGQEKAREAAEARREADAFRAALKKDPRAALREALGADGLSSLSIQVIQQMMEEEELQRSNPQEIERRRASAEVEKLKAEAEELRRGKESAEADQYAAQATEKLGADIKTALESGKIPTDPYTVKRLAALMYEALDQGVDADDLSVADFIPLVNETLEKEHTSFLANLSGEDLISRYPKMAEKIRAAYVKKAKGPAQHARAPRAETPEREAAKPPRRVGRVSALDAFVTGR